MLQFLEKNSKLEAGARTKPNTPPLVAEFSPLNKSDKSLLKLVRVPKDKLKEVGQRGEGRNGDETPLRIAVARGAPVQVVAALCELFPQSASISDVDGWLPIHHAVKSSCADDVLSILVASHPAGLIARDKMGRTPLHILFTHHADTCPVSIVDLLSDDVKPEIFTELTKTLSQTKLTDYGAAFMEKTKLPNMMNSLPPLPIVPSSAVPPNSAIIPDSIHGCLPLHYAVMKDAPTQVIRHLLEKYPASIRTGDRYGRTPLGWYLGGSHWEAQEQVLELKMDIEATPRGSSKAKKEELLTKVVLEHARSLKIVTGSLLPGEQQDAHKKVSVKKRAENNAMDKLLLHRAHRSSHLILLLLSQHVAHVVDHKKRLPLHFAIRLFALSLLDPPEYMSDTNKVGNDIFRSKNGCIDYKAIKRIVEFNRDALVMQDINGQTPLHILFSTSVMWNEKEYDCLLKEGKLNGRDVSGACPFLPPNVLVSLLQLIDVRMATDQSTTEALSKNKMKLGCSAKVMSGKLDSTPATVSTKSSGSEGFDDIDHISDEYAFLHSSNPEWSNIDSDNTLRDNDVQLLYRNMENNLPGSNPSLATNIEDNWGMLPIHYAVLTASSSEIIRALVKSYPMSLLHTSSELDSMNNNASFLFQSSNWGGSRTPLHAAFSSPYTSQLQTVDSLTALLGSTSPPNVSKTEEKRNDTMSVDGSLALKIEDSTGRCPLHLASENGAKIDVLKALLTGYPTGALVRNQYGDLPLHLLLDKNLFMNVMLSMGMEAVQHRADTEKEKDMLASLLNDKPGDNGNFKLRDRQSKLRVMSTQNVRLSCQGIGGAVMGQLNGWTSDEDEVHFIKSRCELMQKVNLLLAPLVKNASLLQVADSKHGMTPLHIAVAFHSATYDTLHAILREFPLGASVRTQPVIINPDEAAPVGYTPLDLHVIRCMLPNEVSPGQMKSWHAVRELLFSFELYPLGGLIKSNGKINLYRRDRDLLMRCVNIIRADASDFSGSEHKVPCQIVDPLHLEIGLKPPMMIECYQMRENDNKKKGPLFSDVAVRVWTFLTTFTNPLDEIDHYAPYVEHVVAGLDSQAVQNLIGMEMPSCSTSNRTGMLRKLNGLTVQDCANVNCRAIMHSTFYFAGLFDFTPPPPPMRGDLDRGESILVHKGAAGQSLLLRATEHNFMTAAASGDTDVDNKQEGKDGTGLEVTAAYLFEGEGGGIKVAETSAHNNLLSNFRVTTRPVCMKFIRDFKSYEREVRSRQLIHAYSCGSNSPGVPILSSYNATRTERISDKRYAHDLQDPRFQKLPLYNIPLSFGQEYGKDGEDIVDISQYPYCVVLPLSTESDLSSAFFNNGIDTLDQIKETTSQIAQSLKLMHDNSEFPKLPKFWLV